MSNDIQQYDFQVKFDGQLHQVDAHLFINSLLSLSTIIQEVNDTIAPQEKATIKIKAPERGSFSLLISLFSEHLPNLFDKDVINYAANIFDILVGVFTIKALFFKNGQPKKVDKVNEDGVRIEWNNGEIHIDKSVTYNIYSNNQTVQDNLGKTFETLSQDPAIEEFKIFNQKGKQVFDAKQEHFSGLSEVKPTEKGNSVFKIDEDAKLFIFKIVFAEKYKWEFYYNGVKISTFIQDDDFYKKIDNGQVSFAKGDQLIANLQIEQVFDKSVNTFINHRYTILKVHEHIPRKQEKQIPLDIKDTDIPQ